MKLRKSKNHRRYVFSYQRATHRPKYDVEVRFVTIPTCHRILNIRKKKTWWTVRPNKCANLLLVIHFGGNRYTFERVATPWPRNDSTKHWSWCKVVAMSPITRFLRTIDYQLAMWPPCAIAPYVFEIIEHDLNISVGKINCCEHQGLVCIKSAEKPLKGLVGGKKVRAGIEPVNTKMSGPCN